MITILFVSLIIGMSNAEFLNTAKDQMEKGHTWEYVGKQTPVGVPAIHLYTKENTPYIIFKLKK